MFLRLMLTLRRVYMIDWVYYLIIIGALFVGGAILIPYFESGNAAFQTPLAYAWWFVVTLMTVGYGDIAPTTQGGRIVAIIIMLTGIATAAGFAGKLLDTFMANQRLRKQGRARLKMKNHIVIFGYNKSKTEQLIGELTRETRGKKDIVLVSVSQKEHPLPQHPEVSFVHGEMHTSEDVMSRACVSEASMIVIHPQDDTDGLGIAVMVVALNKSAHIVAYFVDPHVASIVKTLDGGRIECVLSVSVWTMAHALTDPGTSQVIERLLNTDVDSTVRCLVVPPGVVDIDFFKFFQYLKVHHDAILVGVQQNGMPVDVNPKGDTHIVAGTKIFYVSERRLENLEWNTIDIKC